MDTPPPLPPSLPNSNSQPPKRGISGGMIAIIVTVAVLIVVAIIAALAFPAYNAIQKKAKEVNAQNQAAVKPPEKPITDEQKQKAMKFAEQVAANINAGKGEAVSAMTDFEGVAMRTFADTDLPFPERAGFKKGISGKPGGLLAQVIGAKVRPLRFHERDGFPAVTIRVLPATGGVNYFDLLLRPDGESFKIIDLYGYLFGSFSSAEARQAMVMMMGQDTNAIARLLGVSGGDKKSMELIMNMFRQMSNGDAKSVHHTYELLPEKIQRSRPAFIAHVQALQSLQSDPVFGELYAHTLGTARSVLGNESAMDLLLVDLYFFRKDFKGVHECLERVHQQVGDDAYLFHLMGMGAIKDKDYKLATECLKNAEKVEPELMDLVDLRLQVRAANGDFAGVVAEMQRFTKATGAKLTPTVFSEPVYDDFKRSPEFANWAKSLTASPR